MTTLNEIEKLDNLLLKLDGVRFALPAVIHSISQVTASAAPPAPNGILNPTAAPFTAVNKAVGASPEEHVNQYRKQIQLANDSLDELQSSSRVVEELLKRLAPTDDDDVVNLPLRYSQRTRLDPFTHRRIDSSDLAPRWRHSPYPSKSSQKSDLESVSFQLEQRIKAYPALKLRSNLSKDNQRVFSVQLAGLATFYVLLTVRKSNGSLTFQRINAFDIKEDKHAYELSEHVIWREVSHQATDAIKSGTRPSSAGVNVDGLLSLLASYASLYEAPCSLPSCRRLLHSKSLLPPTARQYGTSVKTEKDSHTPRGAWHPFHAACLPQGFNT